MEDNNKQPLFAQPGLRERVDDVSRPEVREAHQHPLDPKITSPREAMEHLRRSDEPVLRRERAVLERDAPIQRRRVWITGGRDRNDYYVLNWSGPLDSDYDWVALQYDAPMGGVILTGTFGCGWQWATKGNQFVTCYDPYTLVEQEHAPNLRAGYFI